MSEDSHATGPIAAATLRAARRMGLSRLFLQTVAQEVPDETLQGVRLEHGPHLTIARARHLCDDECDLSPFRCLTALKLQAIVGRERKAPFAISQVSIEGHDIRVHLVTLARME